MYCEINGKKILFIHIPKCAGTSIEYALAEMCDPPTVPSYDLPNLSSLLGPLWIEERSYWLQHLTMMEIFDDLKLRKHIRNLEVEKLDYIFAIVRNPYQKYVSEENFLRYKGSCLARILGKLIKLRPLLIDMIVRFVQPKG